MQGTFFQKFRWGVSVLALLAVALSACSGALPQPAAETAPAATAPAAAETAGAVVTAAAAAETEPAATSQANLPLVVNTGNEPVKLKVVIQPFINFVPFFIAEKEGYFDEQGLEVELVTIQQTQQVMPALSSGEVDVASGLVSAALFNAVGRGGQFRIVADKGFVDPQGCANHALIAQKDQVAAIQTAADLKGKTIDVVPASWLEYYLDKLLESGGLTRADIQTTDLPAASEPEAFANGSLQFTLNSEPWTTRFRKAGHLQILTPAEQLMPNSTSAVTLFGPSLLGENIEVGQRVMVAYLKAVRQYNEGKTARNLELLAEFTQLDPADLQEMCWPALRSDGMVNLEDIDAFQAWAQSAGYLDAVVPVEQYWDGRFIEYANQQLGEAP